MSDRIFLTENVCSLFSNLSVLPSKDMNKAEKLNALTRLVIVVSIVMYFCKYKWWSTFLIISLLIILVLYYYGNSQEGFMKKSKPKKEEEQYHSENEYSTPIDGVEHFSIVPTYTGTDFQQTIIAPTFAEEWQIPPPAYDIYTQVPYPGESSDTFETPLQPQSYPYGQYLTRTNLLPSDEYYVHLGCGGARTAREYANSTFLRNDLAYRENMMRIYKKKLNRRFRSNGGMNDTFSPYNSY